MVDMRRWLDLWMGGVAGLLGLLLGAVGAVAQGPAPDAVMLKPVGRYDSGIFGRSAAEIPAYCVESGRLFVVNAERGDVDVLDMAALPALRLIGTVGAASGERMGSVNSIAVHGGVLAVVVAARPRTDPGRVLFYQTASLALLGSAAVGAEPDMVTFTPDGRRVLVADEASPNDDYTIDPEGSISIVDVSAGFAAPVVRQVYFRDWNEGGARVAELPELRRRGLRHFGRVTVSGAEGQRRPSSVSEDLEPEWITVRADGQRAYVSLQEANAIAEIDVEAGTVLRLLPLGFKDHGAVGNEVDVSDRDGGIRLRRWPGLYGVFQPDTIRWYEVNGRGYLVTANEGDARVRRGGFSDEARLKDWPLEGSAFAALAGDADLGRLELVRDLVDAHRDDAGRPTRLFAFGARSFSIFDVEDGVCVYDSGADFERITAERLPALFNANHQEPGADKRSRAKGPEPEGLALGTLGGRTYAFIGLERVGGVMIYDISDPRAGRFVGYYNNRREDGPVRRPDGTSNPAAGDLGPEGLIFIPAGAGTGGRPLLVVAYEISGSTVVYEVTPSALPVPAP